MYGGTLLPLEEDGELSRRTPNDGTSTEGGACCLLREGEITGCVPLPRGSNDVFLLSLRHNGQKSQAIYKPRRGERPLYDFPHGTLYQREYAAYLVSQSLEWNFIPPTIIRDGPFGPGSLQWFVTTSPVFDFTNLLKKRYQEFKRVAVFDWLVNNADRKSGHCLEGLDGKLWLIDHGLTFQETPNLRTVVWDFADQPVPKKLLADLERFRHNLNGGTNLRTALARLLSNVEIEALEERLKLILDNPVFPSSFGSYYRTPWLSFRERGFY